MGGTSAHVLLAKVSHIITPDLKAAWKYSLFLTPMPNPMCLGRVEPETLVNNPNRFYIMKKLNEPNFPSACLVALCLYTFAHVLSLPGMMA